MLKKISFLTLAVLASLSIFTGCRGDEDVYSKPEVTISPNEDIRVDATSQSKTIQINTNRPWRVLIDEAYSNWIDITPMEGEPGTTSITITVKSNEEAAREGIFTIKSSIVAFPINVIQADSDGNTIEYVSIKELREQYLGSGKKEWQIDKTYKLKGVVTSDKISQNLYKSNLFIQDESGYGLSIRFAGKHDFRMGEIISIDLYNQTILDYRGTIQLGDKGKEVNLSVVNKIGTGDIPAPKELTIEEIKEKNDNQYDGLLVKIKDIQFKEYNNSTYYDEKNSDKGYGTNRLIENCTGNKLIVRTLKFATFSNKNVPAGKGNLIGILSRFRNDWQLTIRNLDDIKEMSNDPATRCDGGGTVTPGTDSKITIGALRNALKEGETYAEEHYIKGEVIMNPANENIPGFIAYVADETGGISLTFSDNENIVSKLPLGGKVKVHVKGAK